MPRQPTAPTVQGLDPAVIAQFERDRQRALDALDALDVKDKKPEPFFSFNPAEVKEYLLSIEDKTERRKEALRIYRERDARKKAYQKQIKQNQAVYNRATRKARIAAGIPAAKHAASRNAARSAFNRAKSRHLTRPRRVYP